MPHRYFTTEISNGTATLRVGVYHSSVVLTDFSKDVFISLLFYVNYSLFSLHFLQR